MVVNMRAGWWKWKSARTTANCLLSAFEAALRTSLLQLLLPWAHGTP